MANKTTPAEPLEEEERITVTVPRSIAQRFDLEVGRRKAQRRARFGGKAGPYTRSDLIAEELDKLLPALPKP